VQVKDNETSTMETVQGIQQTIVLLQKVCIQLSHFLNHTTSITNITMPGEVVECLSVSILPEVFCLLLPSPEV